MGVGINDGAQRPLSGERWYNVNSLQWLKDGSGLFIVRVIDPSSLLKFGSLVPVRRGAQNNK